MRRVTASGTISTIAGNTALGITGSAGNGGPATSGRFNKPWGVVGDPNTSSVIVIGESASTRHSPSDLAMFSLCVFSLSADSGNNVLRRIFVNNYTFASANVAGNGSLGSAGAPRVVIQ